MLQGGSEGDPRGALRRGPKVPEDASGGFEGSTEDDLRRGPEGVPEASEGVPKAFPEGGPLKGSESSLRVASKGASRPSPQGRKGNRTCGLGPGGSTMNRRLRIG